MRKIVARVVASTILVSTFSCMQILAFKNPASADLATAFESMTGTNAANMVGTSGSSDSVGFTGNWTLINATKTPDNSSAISPIFSTNANFAYPTNSKFTSPGSNTVAASTALYSLYYAAREMATAVSFDVNSVKYYSFLMYLTGTGSGTHGSGVVGLLNGLPASTSDTSYKSLLAGYSYSTPGALVINYNNANNAIWNSGSFGATAAGSEPSSSGKSWFVLVKLTTAASGNDTIQVEEFAPTSTIPTDPSTITWDATYTTPITGNWKYVAIQLEAGGYVDDFRLGDSYEAATGLQQPAVLGTPTLSTQAFKGNKTTISVSSNASGTVRFYVDGKRIPSCLAQATTGSGNSYSATCSWSPPVQGQHKISATLTPSSNLFLSTSSQSLVTQVKKRTNTR